MRDYTQLEEIIKDCLDRYREGFNKANLDYEIEFQTTLTHHAVEVQHVNAWVAYLRLEKVIRPKDGKEEEEERLLIYNQAYKFKSVAERTIPNAPWKYDLYMDLMQRLMHGGIEYAELLKRMQLMSQGKAGQPIAQILQPEDKEIIITDQMPAPLSDEEKKYLEWLKHNKA